MGSGWGSSQYGAPCKYCGTTQMGKNFTRCCTRCYQRRLRAARAAQRLDCVCASCSKQFKPKRSDAVYCSVACKQRAYRLRA